ncbi:histone acetyltransferase SAS3 [Geosmithia morbida]|uniref:Histone acetyltransferase n=1 Tax=Geosmithia morbida TaxID=1094350 RepID=A0A9P5D0F8_9HYPO|nr:histone acetyltransferase SAS3 [Geosmithia morbida]KAF4122688.1 histone acetyltransferase SAS3 [Geosmithia morbida]
MASAQAMEEELQQSVLLSQETDEIYDASNSNATTASQRNIKVVSFSNDSGVNGVNGVKDIESDRDASGEEVEEEDAEGEDDLDLMPQPNDYPATALQNGHTEIVEEEDAEGEEEDAEGEEEEVVGAVKIKPADLVDDEDEDAEEDDGAESDASDAQNAADEDSDEEEEEEDPPWEDARDAVEDEEEGSELAATNICVFCKQDEEHDPSEDFEAFLACQACGENAHQQCARDEDALNERNDSTRWRCPECYNEDEPDAESAGDRESPATDARLASQESEVPMLVKAGSVEEMVMDDDASSSRMLRKRKTSSIDPDDGVLALRKRRRNTSTDLRNDDGADGSDGGSRSARSLRLKVAGSSSATIEKHTRTSLIVKLRVRPGSLKETMGRKRRGNAMAGGRGGRGSRRTGTGRPPGRPPRNATPLSAITSSNLGPLIETPFTADSYSQPFYSFFDRDTDDTKGKPYGDILTEAEADTTKTLPAAEDRRRFDQAKRKADDEWRARVLAVQAETYIPVRKQKKTGDHASQIECIEFGGWEIDTWYAAPYPAEYSRNRVLYICEFCLKYMNSDYVAWRHKLKCAAKHPPGDEIYRHGSISFFEVDGRKNPIYCQNLCLLAKLFLGSKTLYYDVEPFLFYVLCEYDECGYHFVGYFSKEKRPSSLNNVSCILTLPIHQRKGYGNLLIDFSYLLTKVEEKTGSPEKPLSDLGLVSYRSYWRLVLCRYLVETLEKGSCKVDGLSIKKISDDTAMTPDDVVAALEGLRAIVRDPQTKLYAFRVDVDFCRQYVADWESKGHVKLKPEALAWTPYVMGRGSAANLEMAPISTVASREEDEAKLDEGLGAGVPPKAMMNGIRKAAVVAGNGIKCDVGTTVADGEEGPADQLKVEAASQGTDGGYAAATGEGEEDDKGSATPRAGDHKMDTEEPAWDAPYKNIPSTRFEIFPPMGGGRRGGDRSRQSVGRPGGGGPRRFPSANTPRPRPRRPSGPNSARRTSSSASSRPKSSSRRKSGGTGRGPGRWPKGTKKADYGNAMSGPGFPPGWNEKQGQPPPQPPPPPSQGAEAAAATSEAAHADREEVRVLVSTTSAAEEANGGGSGGAVSAQDEEDVDAEGEDDI